MKFDFSKLKSKRLTERVHEALSYCLKPGDYAVDATVGNGHDTLFLAKTLAPHGKVFGFDIQPIALENARKRLANENLSNIIYFFNQGHEHMIEAIKNIDPTYIQNRIQSIIFNLGYLPGTDKQITTQASTTLEALNKSLEILFPSGILSIMVYPGHAAGKIEKEKINFWINDILSRNSHFFIHREGGASHNPDLSPEWIWIQQLSSPTLRIL